MANVEQEHRASAISLTDSCRDMARRAEAARNKAVAAALEEERLDAWARLVEEREKAAAALRQKHRVIVACHSFEAFHSKMERQAGIGRETVTASHS